MIPVHAPPRPRPRAPAPPAAAPPANARVRHWWGWVRHILRDGQAYLDRYSLRAQGPSGTNPWRVYLHQFHAPDGPGHHNHPSAWSFSVVLWGSYTEEIMTGTSHNTVVGHGIGPVVARRRVRWFNWISADRYHRIAELHPGPGTRNVWTVFVCGPLTGRGWGFWRAGIGHVPVETGEGANRSAAWVSGR